MAFKKNFLAADKHILVIDDDESILEVIRLVLTMEGYVVTVDNRGDYLGKIGKKDYPDLVLLDVLLRGKDGKEICKKLKSNSKTAGIPVIIVSAHTPQEVEKAAIECNADDFLTKPFDTSDLNKTVRKHLS